MDELEVQKERDRENLRIAAELLNKAERDTLRARHANDSTAAALQSLDELNQQLRDLGQAVDTSAFEEAQHLAHIAEATYLESKKALEVTRTAYAEGVSAFVNAYGEEP